MPFSGIQGIGENFNGIQGIDSLHIPWQGEGCHMLLYSWLFRPSDKRLFLTVKLAVFHEGIGIKQTLKHGISPGIKVL